MSSPEGTDKSRERTEQQTAAPALPSGKDLKEGIDSVRKILAGNERLSDNEVRKKAIEKLRWLFMTNGLNQSPVDSNLSYLKERVADSDDPVSLEILKEEFPGIDDIGDIASIVNFMSNEWNKVVDQEEKGGDQVATSLDNSLNNLKKKEQDIVAKSKKTSGAPTVVPPTQPYVPTLQDLKDEGYDLSGEE